MRCVSSICRFGCRDVRRRPVRVWALWETPEDYEKLKAYLYGDQLIGETDAMLAAFAADDAQRDTAVWFSIEGFFWFPRTLFGIENHFYAFYDYPDLLLEINRDLCAYYKRLRRRYSDICGQPT